MPEGIIDLLERIDIDGKQDDFGFEPMTVLELLISHHFKATPVVQTGQFIGKCLKQQLILQGSIAGKIADNQKHTNIGRDVDPSHLHPTSIFITCGNLHLYCRKTVLFIDHTIEELLHEDTVITVYKGKHRNTRQILLSG